MGVGQGAVEELVVNAAFWCGKRVLVTGHTGFKGGWLSLCLQQMGAIVTGYSLSPPTRPSLFEVAAVDREMHSVIGDVRDLSNLRKIVDQARPQIVFHAAAQALVRQSYQDPVTTYATNVLGTVHVLEALRSLTGVRAVVVVTSDKCYQNREWTWGYREADRLGGRDPYSNSKACTELVVDAFRSSFFNSTQHPAHGLGLATARAGNVIGGGDWADDRLVPDILRALERKQVLVIRNPQSIRPWQHVLEPVSGYLRLAEALWEDGPRYADAWNFGPSDDDAREVSWIVEEFQRRSGQALRWQQEVQQQPHEASYLRLDCSKARQRLNWRPHWSLSEALQRIWQWHQAHAAGQDMRALTLAQIDAYSRT